MAADARKYRGYAGDQRKPRAARREARRHRREKAEKASQYVRDETATESAPPEEAFAIRSKGGKAAAKKRREEKLVKDALLNLLTKPQHKKKGGKAHYKASAELTSYDDVFSENTTLMVQMLIPLIQSAINGNIDSLFAILRVLGQEPGTPGQFGVDEFTSPEPLPEGAGGPGKPTSADDPNAVRIHLIRGEKPAPVAEGDVPAVEQADADQANAATPVTTPADGEAVFDA